MTTIVEKKANSNSIPHITCAVITQGNIMGEKERSNRLKELDEDIERGWVDKEIIPYLERINKFPFLVTTQSCCGHNEDRDGRRAHVDFRSMLNEANTINKILRPFAEKRNPLDVGIELMIEPYGIRYIIWMRNDRWQNQLEDFIKTLDDYNGVKRDG